MYLGGRETPGGQTQQGIYLVGGKKVVLRG